MNTKDNSIKIGNIHLQLSEPVQSSQKWIGQIETLRQLLACWLIVAEEDLPLAPRIAGLPGVGKTTLAMAAAAERNQELFIYQCTADTRPEDLLVTPVLAESGTIAYHASPLVTAMVSGGVCILDEGNRMNEKSWASLAPLLDHRRYVESVVAGVVIHADKEFRCAVTMNEDESTYEIPDYILSRLQPTISLGFPERDDEMSILKYHLPFAEDDLLALTVDFLQRSHELKLDFSPRDGIHLLQYMLKRLSQDSSHPLSRDKAWYEALQLVLGEEAMDLEAMSEKKKQALGGEFPPMGLGSLLFGDLESLNPDNWEDEEDDE
ncbi:MAG: AAA family ATPase [Planctomycetota bacterium]|nr:AAA family ATPase [Planctomycetota bacterium]